MPLICPDSPMPSLDGIIASFKPLLTFPPPFPELPNLTIFLPGLPSPLFPSLRLPNMEMIMSAIELQMFQLQQTIMNIVKPILDKLGIDLFGWLPKIPGLALNLMDLIAGAPEKLIAAVKAAIENGFRWPGIPWPLYPTLNIPDIEILQILKMITADYMQKIVTMAADIIAQVTKKFKLPGMPTLPTFPTMAELMDMIKAMIPDIRIPDLDIMAMLAKIKIPGFPALPAIPWPLIPSFDIPDINMILGMISLQLNLTLGPLKIIMDFIESTLKKIIGFSFPTFCITLPEIKLPEIEIPEIPNVPDIEISVGLPKP